jgi:hypothetical protein
MFIFFFLKNVMPIRTDPTFVILYRVIHFKTPIKKVYSRAQGDHQEEGRILPCLLIAPISLSKFQRSRSNDLEMANLEKLRYQKC